MGACKERITELEGEQTNFRTEVSCLELELREANSSQLFLNAKNKELKASRQLAEVQMGRMRPLLTEVEEARDRAEAEVAKKIETCSGLV